MFTCPSRHARKKHAANEKETSYPSPALRANSGTNIKDSPRADTGEVRHIERWYLINRYLIACLIQFEAPKSTAPSERKTKLAQKWPR